MTYRKTIEKAGGSGRKSSSMDPMWKETELWAKEMQSVLSPYWASRSAYPEIIRKSAHDAQDAA